MAQVFSAEDPESLRGPQFSAAWCDELAKWRHAEATFDMLQFGLRLGERPRQVITTTPRPIALLKRLIADPRDRGDARRHGGECATIWRRRFSTRWSRAIAGTRLGRQELDGEIVEERADALWSRALIEALPGRRGAAAVRASWSRSIRRRRRGKRADACGLVAAGRAEDGTIYVLADETAAGLSPAGWARKAIALWRRLQADALVVEVNQGGDMVRAVIARGRSRGAGDARCARIAANICAPSRSPRSTSRAG